MCTFGTPVEEGRPLFSLLREETKRGETSGKGGFKPVSKGVRRV